MLVSKNLMAEWRDLDLYLLLPLKTNKSLCLQSPTRVLSSQQSLIPECQNTLRGKTCKVYLTIKRKVHLVY